MFGNANASVVGAWSVDFFRGLPSPQLLILVLFNFPSPSSSSSPSYS